MDLQSAYNQSQPGADDSSAQQSQAQDLTVPAAAVQQIVQAIQQQDCATVCKMMAQLISAAAQGGGDADQDGQ